MKDHFQYSNEQLEQLFEDCTLPPEYFSHEAHLRLAWIHIRRYGVEQAIANITTQIKAYATSLGAAQKYHHTVTVAAVKVVEHFMGRSDSDDFAALIVEFPRIKYQFKELLFSHYSVDIFALESARFQYLEPDLLPFDS